MRARRSAEQGEGHGQGEGQGEERRGICQARPGRKEADFQQAWRRLEAVEKAKEGGGEVEEGRALEAYETANPPVVGSAEGKPRETATAHRSLGSEGKQEYNI